MTVGRRLADDWPWLVVLLGALAIGVAAWTAQPARASGGDYGWTDCNWVWKESQSSKNITIKWDGSWPGDGWGDGVKNSFFDGMSDSISRWNSVLNGVGSASDLVRVTGTTYNILATYQTVMNQPRGFTSIDAGQSCPVHDTSLNSIFSAIVYASVRSDWFTQDDSRRAYWETNCPAGTGTVYTCSKHEDFGSTFMHEIGHAVGFIAHPQDVRTHGSTQAFNLAECGDILRRATMCPSGGEWYRSERRTQHNWDVESLRQIYARF